MVHIIDSSKLPPVAVKTTEQAFEAFFILGTLNTAQQVYFNTPGALSTGVMLHLGLSVQFIPKSILL